MSQTVCRFCGAPVEAVFADLGMSPLANSYLSPEQANSMEPFYPLRALVCGNCFLVQLEEFETPERIFSDYAYFSSYSSSWLDHARRYSEQMIDRLGLDANSHVVEIASNDGYLLQYFHERQIPVLGIEPAGNVAKVALQKGIPTLVEFFGVQTASSLAGESSADLLLGNNVLAHVPDLNDFVGGMKVLLKPGGVITMEFPHLMRLIEENQWDTIYHEHFSYFSFLTVSRVFEAHGLKLYDVEELPTHGGSLRIYGAHAEDGEKAETEAARELAPAKGNTLLNYCGIGPDFIDYTCDLNPHKQGHFLPGSHIPIRSPEQIREDRPDVVVILPWNLTEEIVGQLDFIKEWGGRFAARTPELKLLS